MSSGVELRKEYYSYSPLLVYYSSFAALMLDKPSIYFDCG